MGDANEIRRYSAPPVVEAVVQIVFAEPMDDFEFRKVSARIRREYSTYEELETVNANVNFEARSAEFSSNPSRKMASEDQADALSISHESVSWVRLAPYDGWEAFKGRVVSNYDAIKTVLGYRRLARLGVRYINRIDVPFNEVGDSIPYEEYLAIHLRLPADIYNIRNYGWRFEYPIDGFTSVVQSASVEPVVPDTGSFLLDIDIIATSDIPPKFDDVVHMLERMRDVKNRMFEMCVTDLARESFSA